MAANRELISGDEERRATYVMPRGDRSVQAQPPTELTMRLGAIARLKNGREISEHTYTMLRHGHSTIEAAAAQEAAAITLINGGRIRMQIAHRGGEMVREYGPDSAAYAIAPDILQAVYDKANAALGDIEDALIEQLKETTRRRR